MSSLRGNALTLLVKDVFRPHHSIFTLSPTEFGHSQQLISVENPQAILFPNNLEHAQT